MNIAELSKVVADRTNLSTSQAREVLEAAFGEIISQVSSGESVSLLGFGAFTPRRRAARSGRNPRTGEPFQTPEIYVPAFRAYGPFKESVRNSMSSTREA